MARPLIFTLAALFLFACGQNSMTSKKEIGWEAPKLLDRHEKLQNGKEWDEVQNFYGTRLAEIRKDPKALEPRLKLAELFVQEARVTGEHPYYYPAALRMVDEIEAAKPTDKDLIFRTLATKAGIQLSLHDFSKARETAEKAVAMNPYNAQIYGCLVDACVELGDYKKAVEMADKMVSIRPDLRSYSRVSYLREIHGDLPGAIEAMEMAVDAGYPGYENTEWARLTLGELFEKKGDSKAARNCYEMALAARSDYPFAMQKLAGLEMSKNNFQEAEKWLKQAIEIIPEVGFYVDLATIYQKTNRPEEAKKLVSEIYEMMEEDSKAGHHMALEQARVALELEGNPQRALEFAKLEEARRPENQDVKNCLSAIYEKMGQKTTVLN